MPFGKLIPKQAKVVSKHVRGQVVTDLGAGDLSLSKRLLKLGALHVCCIDKEDKPKGVLPARLSYAKAYFQDMGAESPIDVAFISWPSNYDNGLITLIEKARVVIYLGCNTDGSACGTPHIFRHLLRRELLDYEPHHDNSLIVVGKSLDTYRSATGEELAGVRCFEAYYSFKEAEARAAQLCARAV